MEFMQRTSLFFVSLFTLVALSACNTVEKNLFPPSLKNGAEKNVRVKRGKKAAPKLQGKLIAPEKKVAVALAKKKSKKQKKPKVAPAYGCKIVPQEQCEANLKYNCSDGTVCVHWNDRGYDCEPKVEVAECKS